MSLKVELTQEIVKELLHYDPETGVFVWRQRARKWFANLRACNVWNTRFADRVAGKFDACGYRVTTIFDKDVKMHRLAWLYMTGVWPSKHIDHEDGNAANNKWGNLRGVDDRENGKNQKRSCKNASGVTEVSWAKERNKWQCYITVNQKRLSLGRFSCFDDAVSARKRAEKQYGFHPNHGSVR